MYLSSTVVPVGQTYQKITCFFGPLQRVIFGAKNGIPTAVFDTPEKVGKHDDWPEGGTLPKSPPSPLPIRNTSIAIWAWGYLFLIWRIMFWVKKTCGFRSGCVRKDGSGCVRNLQLEKNKSSNSCAKKKASEFAKPRSWCLRFQQCFRGTVQHSSQLPLLQHAPLLPVTARVIPRRRAIKRHGTGDQANLDKFKFVKTLETLTFSVMFVPYMFFLMSFRGIRGLCLVSDMQLSCAG